VNHIQRRNQSSWSRFLFNSATLAFSCGAFLLSGCGSTQFGLQNQTASFQQAPTRNNKVDILFISDDSTSMLTYRQQLSLQSQTIVNRLTAMGIDFHIAVTTTSIGAFYAGGTFVGAPNVITNSTPNVAASLAANLNFNLAGSDLEQGLSSMDMVLSNSSYASSFLRPDAMLAVIVISDDDDYSSGTTATYQSYLNQLKPPFANGAQSWVLNYVGTTSLQSACAQFVNVGTRYLSLVAASGGISQSICGADWSVVMTNIQVVINSVITDYYLSQAPNLATVVVKVNGVVVPQDATNGWSYLTGTSSAGAPTYYIHFNGTSVPPLYASVAVNFTPASAK